MKGFKVLVGFAVLIFTPVALALPEMARYGHFTCTTCHVSPGGAGTLTSYGRDFSARKLSTWNYNNEENPLHGLLPLSDHFLLGGDGRWVSTEVKTPDSTFKKIWRMQTDIEAGVHFGPAWLMYTVGTTPAGPMTEAKEANKIVTRSYMARVDLLDDHIILRAGLFMPKYGLMLSDHTAYVRNASGLNPDSEQTQAEVIYQNDSFEATAAVLIKSTAFEREDKSKSGFNIGFSAFLFKRNRLNINFMNTTLEGDTQDLITNTFGTSGVISIFPRFYGMFEIDRVQNITKSETSKKVSDSLANYFSLNLEVYKGIIPFTQYEYLDKSINAPNTSTQRWGGGLNLYPRPHFQFQARMLRAVANTTQIVSNQTDFVLHYYF